MNRWKTFSTLFVGVVAVSLSIAVGASSGRSETRTARSGAFRVRISEAGKASRQIEVREHGGAEVSLGAARRSNGSLCLSLTVSAPRGGVRAGRDFRKSCKQPADVDARILPLCPSVVAVVLPLSQTDGAPRFSTANHRTGRLAIVRTQKGQRSPRLAVGIWTSSSLPVHLTEDGGAEIGDLDPIATYC